MAFNPFLDMGEAAAPVTAEGLNPFMMSSEPEPMTTFAGDNPFATSNPFSDFGGGYEPPIGDTVPVDIFGGGDPQVTAAFTTNTLDFYSNADTDTEPLQKPTELDIVSVTTTDTSLFDEQQQPMRPPLPSRPLPPETQNLIQSVTGQMEFTSSHLLDRIPPTRTPSPVSVRDIHSPSPTPDLDLEEQLPPESLDINRNKPTRPPPARPAPPVARPPPPRPAPPPPPPQAPLQQSQHTDDINLFDAPAPVVVKPTKEAILSLYSVPKKEEKPVDFLSDDIISDAQSAGEDTTQAGAAATGSVFSATDNMSSESKSEFGSEFSTAPSNEPKFENTAPDFGVSDDNADSVPMDCTEYPNESDSVKVENSPFNDFANDNVVPEVDNGMSNPFENVSSEYSDTGVGTGIFSNENADFSQPQNIFGEYEPPSEPVDNSKTVYESEMTSKKSETAEPAWPEEPVAPATWPSRPAPPPPPERAHVAKPPVDAWSERTTAAWPDEPMTEDLAVPESEDAFDAFSAKFDSTAANNTTSGAWGDDGGVDGDSTGFEAEAFDPFLSMGAPPPPAATPRLDHQGSKDSNDDNFTVFIRPKDDSGASQTVPALAPPPRPMQQPESPRFNPFDKTEEMPPPLEQPHMDHRRSSGSDDEGPPTPLFDEDVSMPLEDFPRTKYDGPGWEMQLRQPNKKKITGQRFWKKIFVRLTYQGDNPVVQLYKQQGDKEPFQELPLQACYSVSDIGAQQFDQFGKIFTVKLQYVFYKERPGVRPGQVTKAERLTNKLSQFAAYAIQGDYQGVKEFGSDLRKLGLPVEHAPQVSQLFKLGSLNYEDVKQFSCCIEEALFRLAAHRDRALTYKLEEVQITVVDELYVEQDAEGSVHKQIARVRVFFLGFLSGMPDVEIGVNDLRRQGKEVVGRHDIIPVATEEWIRVEDSEFHACVQPEDFTQCQILKFKPPDACYIELMRFRVRPPKNRELPLQLKAVWCVTGNKVELRADVLVPGFASRKLGQIPCEDVSIRFPIPECWIYLFRVEKHFRYGSVKSAHRRTGKIKGIERFLGAVDTLQESLIEVTSGQAKYEHQHRAIVWRMPRLPKEGQGAYTTHNLVCRMALTSYDQIPAELARFATVEFTMPATQVSHTTVRSVSLQQHDGDPPEKCVRHLARHEYIVGIERTTGQDAPAYSIATKVDTRPAAAPAPAPAPAPAAPSSDSDSD